MKYLRIYFLIALPTFSWAFLNYDRAIVAGQKNNWTASAELLKKELIENPESAQLLYDTGVSSYKNGDYDYALSYFLKASETPNAPALLQEQALFNAGNTQVALKQLENALASFEKVLERNPQNAKATHNKEMVKKMLEEQKQQQQQNQKNDQNKDEQKDKKEQKQKNDQKDNNEQNKQEQNKEQQHNNQSDKQKKNDDEQKDKKEQEQRSEEEKQTNDDKQNIDQQKKDIQQKSDTQNNAQSAPKEQQSHQEEQLTPSMARMLDEREKKDAQLNKQLMRAMAGAQPAGADHHEHYW